MGLQNRTNNKNDTGIQHDFDLNNIKNLRKESNYF